MNSTTALLRGLSRPKLRPATNRETSEAVDAARGRVGLRVLSGREGPQYGTCRNSPLPVRG